MINRGVSEDCSVLPGCQIQARSPWQVHGRVPKSAMNLRWRWAAAEVYLGAAPTGTPGAAGTWAPWPRSSATACASRRTPCRRTTSRTPPWPAAGTGRSCAACGSTPRSPWRSLSRTPQPNPPRLRCCKTSGQTSEEVKNPQSPLTHSLPSIGPTNTSSACIRFMCAQSPPPLQNKQRDSSLEPEGSRFVLGQSSLCAALIAAPYWHTCSFGGTFSDVFPVKLDRQAAGEASMASFTPVTCQKLKKRKGKGGKRWPAAAACSPTATLQEVPSRRPAQPLPLGGRTCFNWTVRRSVRRWAQHEGGEFRDLRFSFTKARCNPLTAR